MKAGTFIIASLALVLLTLLSPMIASGAALWFTATTTVLAIALHATIVAARWAHAYVHLTRVIILLLASTLVSVTLAAIVMEAGGPWLPWPALIVGLLVVTSIESAAPSSSRTKTA